MYRVNREKIDCIVVRNIAIGSPAYKRNLRKFPLHTYAAIGDRLIAWLPKWTTFRWKSSGHTALKESTCPCNDLFISTAVMIVWLCSVCVRSLTQYSRHAGSMTNVDQSRCDTFILQKADHCPIASPIK